MRFGKRLTELSQNEQIRQPYISYKELKHTLGGLPRLASRASGKDSLEGGGDSSGDEVLPPAASNVACAADPDASDHPGAAASSSASSARAKLEEQQHTFFTRIDTDVSMALSHVQSILASLEAGVGDWQCQAAICGLLFTPAQLEEVAANLPFEVADQQTLVQWLVSLQPLGEVRPSRLALAESYSNLASTLQVLLQYIEVNVTAVRKILKKFEKKVPAAFRVRSSQSYSAHHELLTSDLQDLLVAVVHMHRLVMIDMKSFDTEMDVRSSMASPISFVGPETLQVLRQGRMSKELGDLIAGQSSMSFSDVYAKPNPADGRVGATRGGAGGGNSKSAVPASAANEQNQFQKQSPGSGINVISQQVAMNLGNAEMFQGPPKMTPGQPSAPNAQSAGGKPGATPAKATPWTNSTNGFAADTSAGKGVGGNRGRGAGGQGPKQAAAKAGGKRGGRGGANQRPQGSNLRGQVSQGAPSFPDRGQKGQGNSNNPPHSGNGPHGNAATSVIDLVASASQGCYQGRQDAGTGGHGNMSNMQCIPVMMVPTAAWGQPIGPPGSFRANQVSAGGKAGGGKGGSPGYTGMQVMNMGMMPNMDMCSGYMQGVLPQQFNMPMMQDQGYSQGVNPGMGQVYTNASQVTTPGMG